MELALYCPENGYYDRTEIGRHGDFYTNVSSGALFGQLLALQFAEWLEGLPGARLQLVEAGAHDGTLAGDILGWLQDHRSALMARLEYWIIEPSERLGARQRTKLDDFAGHIRWFSDWKSVPGQAVEGVIFSNELLDAFPVRRFGWNAAQGHWFEWAVTTEGDKLTWAQIPLSPEQIETVSTWTGIRLPSELREVLPHEFTFEVAPAAGEWWQRAGRALQAGKLLTFDYGLVVDEWFRPERPRGTLRAYRKHAVVADLLADPGEQDLTAHVNFTQLQRAGEAAGLQTEGLWRQEQFLTRIAERMWRQPSDTVWTREQVRAFQTLTHPEQLGRAFRVLVQAR
jgi:SAM-dependent MidA family methyltransferase